MQEELRIFWISGFNVLARYLTSFECVNIMECDASSSSVLLLLEALQLMRSFGLLNEFPSVENF
jgi:hypothetical protein